jgi:hypothetical protein
MRDAGISQSILKDVAAASRESRSANAPLGAEFSERSPSIGPPDEKPAAGAREGFTLL